MRVLAACLLASRLAACGTITRGTTEQVQFALEPPGAAVTTSIGSGRPTTPCSIEIACSQEFTAKFTMTGQKPDTVAVKTVVSGSGGTSMAGNVLFGGIVGAGGDAYNGTALSHSPNPVVGRLVPVHVPKVGRGQRKRHKPAV